MNMKMKKITINNPETRSADVVAENLERLKALFPEAFTEGPAGQAGKIDFEVLKQLLGGVVNEREEKYGLNWHGKRQARQLALMPSTGTLRPCPEESTDWETTKNLMIEGDNLEVLKLLQKSYAGKVKLIYIDPPYNTGKDFVYPDNYRDNIQNYLELTGQTDGENRKLSSNTEASGRFHTDWLNMMYPRLKLARNLLSDDGTIVVHIDENEYPNLEKILSEIFGKENNLGTIVWDKRNPKGDATGVAQQHELISVYCKNRNTFKENVDFRRTKENAERMMHKASALIRQAGGVTHEVRKEYKTWLAKQDFSGGEKAYTLIDDKGEVSRTVSMAWPNKKKAPDDYFIPLIHPETLKECPVPKRGWRNTGSTMKKLLEKGLIVFGKDESTQPTRKYLLYQNTKENVSSLLYYGGSDDALFSELGLPWDNAKPLYVARRLIQPLCGDGEILMDFFAGSGTAAHATLSLNSEDSTTRRFIMVQLPELILDDTDAFETQFKDIAQISKERLRRAAKKIKNENPMFTGDLGFRVFKLDTSNIRTWEPDRDDLNQTLLDSIDHIKPDRSEEDILYELLLKLGLDLCVPIETRTVSGKAVCAIGGGALITCLDENIAQEEVEPLGLGIADWHAELEPAGDSTVVFRDSAFADDVAKTNLTAILEQRGLKNVRSL